MSVEDAVRLWLVRVWGILVRLGVGVGGLRYHAPGTAYTGTYTHGPEGPKGCGLRLVTARIVRGGISSPAMWPKRGFDSR